MKMKKAMRKRIKIGLLLVISFFAVSMKQTYALNACSGSDVPFKSENVVERYGINFNRTGDKTYELKMVPAKNTAERCKVKFKISSINGNAAAADKYKDAVLTCGHDITGIRIDGTVTDRSTSLESVLIELSSVKDDSLQIPKNENDSGSCYYNQVNAKLTQSADMSADRNPESFGDIPLETFDGKSKVDCSKYNYNLSSCTSFECNFCRAYMNATVKYDKLTTSTVPDSVSLKCDEKVDKKLIGFEEAISKDKTKYFTYFSPYSDVGTDNRNRTYLRASQITESKLQYYYYHYSPGRKTKYDGTAGGDPVKCSVECKEAVEVEYGPPVASKGGLCFEYKVRVTSRVVCDMVKEPDKPKKVTSYCTPYPHCSNSSGDYDVTQGGPSEDFDSCIEDCDGGKYTKKCSKKCYKQVYDTTKNNSKLALRSNDDYSVMKLADDAALSWRGTIADCKSLPENPKGCYYRNGKGAIKWSGYYVNPYYTSGRWYKDGGSKTSTGSWKSGYYVSRSDGFYRYLYDTGFCNDSCTWNDCRKNEYLNPGMAKKDYERNVAVYNKVLKSCATQIKCSTRQSTYTISANYINDASGDKGITVSYPYETKKDILQRKDDGSLTTTVKNSDTTLILNEPSTNEGIYGCYNENSKETNIYRSTWGFPGVWSNPKTHEISFTPESEWNKKDKQFCLPLDTKNVNGKWAIDYFKEKSQNLGLSTTTTWSKCLNSDDLGPDKWNIVAETKNFGKFGWNINISCFYAKYVNSDDDCKAEPLNYRVRSVNTDNLFPDPNGTEITDSSQTGRAAGFNWSTFSAVSGNKKYEVNPPALISKVQNKSNIYNDKELDYELYLSPNNIRKIRDYTKNGNYIDKVKLSDFKDVDGILRYKSKFIRNSEYVSNFTGPTNDSAMYCNNMIDRNRCWYSS